jgi:hypothetical protein
MALSTEFIARYSSVGIEMIDYRDLRGSISSEKGKIVVI